MDGTHARHAGHVFWLSTILAAVLHQDVLAKPALRAMQLLDFWFVIGVLIVMPLAGAPLAVVNFRRQRSAMSVITVLLGLAESGLAILMNSAPPPGY